MRVRDKFKATDDQTRAFLARATWATVVSTREDGFPTATHLPVLCKPPVDPAPDTDPWRGWTIEGHLALSNPHHLLLSSGSPVLCILQGAHCYISSYWYQQPSAPTWNYQSVHLTGRAFLMDEPEQACAHLRELVEQMEGDSVSDSMEHVVTEETFSKLLPAIVAFRIQVDQVDSALKMSQNKDDATHASIVNHLIQRGGVYDTRVAEIMRANRSG